MLYNGEEIGDGSPPAGRHRRRPARGHDADCARAAGGAGGDRAVRARHDVRSRPLRLHGEARRRPRDRRLPQPRRAARARWSKRSPRRKGIGPSDVTVIMLDRARHEEARRRDPRGRRAHPLHHRRRRLRGDDRGQPEAPASTCSGGSAARPRACSRRPRSSASAASILGRLWPRNDEERKAAIDAGYDLDRVLDRRRPGRRRRRLLRRHRRHRRRPARGRPLPRRRPRDDRVAGDALALRHRPRGQGPPRPPEAARGRRRALRLISLGLRRPAHRAEALDQRPGLVQLVAQRVDHRAREQRQG